MAVCQEWDKQDFNFQKHIFGKSSFTQSALKQLPWFQRFFAKRKKREASRFFRLANSLWNQGMKQFLFEEMRSHIG
jgi:hypothetical protein